MEKMTYVVALESVLNILSGAVTLDSMTEETVTAVAEKLNALKAQQEKRNTKPTKAQTENKDLAETLYQVLSTFSEPVAIPELMKADERFSPLVMSSQKVSALLRSLIKADKVERTEVKGRAKFSVK